MTFVRDPEERFISLDEAAHALGVPIAWLRREAAEDRVPHLIVGRSLRFHLPSLKQALLERVHEQEERDRA